FLSALASPDSVKDFISILKILATDNFYCYTTPVHLFVSLSSLGILILNIKSLKDNFPGAYGIISLTGALMVFILMESQFIYHDYYFLDTLFPVMVLIVIYAIGKLPDTNTNWGKVCAIAMLIMLPFMIWLNNTALAKNYSAEAEDKQKIIRQNFSNTESFLKASGVTDTSTILVIDACSANYPFVLMNKKGYSLIYSEADFKKIPDLMSANPDFIILQHNFILSGILTYYPQIISGIKKISDNGKIAIFRRSNRDSVKTIPDFLAINNFQINYHSHTDFDANTNPPFWENIHPTRDNNAFSGKFSGLLDSTIEFSATLKIPAKNLLKPNNQKALIDIHFKSVKKFNGCYMVLSVEDDQKNLFYFSEDIGNNFINQNWARYFCIIPFPDLEKNANAVIKIYLWNKNRNHIRYDNFSVAIIDKDYLK
ncbi:MAG: hypothetical protein HY958_11510, partial [Bacteroidia bacterium]|nr:hypothetical protein [Bacteroidia bacterium]